MENFLIFTFTYNAQFWSYDDVVNIFLVRYEFKKRIRTLSEHSEEKPRFLFDLKGPFFYGVEQHSSRNFHAF